MLQSMSSMTTWRLTALGTCSFRYGMTRDMMRSSKDMFGSPLFSWTAFRGNLTRGRWRTTSAREFWSAKGR